MRKATFLLIFFTLGLVVIISLVTANMLIGVMWLNIVALWLSALLLVVFLGFYLMTYQRIMTRVGITNERLNEVKLLQERRYEQLAKRLDALSQGISSQSPSTRGSVLEGRQTGPKLSELEDLNARAERAERRILGRLENIMLDNDRRFRTVEKVASNCCDHKEVD